MNTVFVRFLKPAPGLSNMPGDTTRLSLEAFVRLRRGGYVERIETAPAGSGDTPDPVPAADPPAPPSGLAGLARFKPAAPATEEAPSTTPSE